MEENWQRYEHHTGPRRASRDDILIALANLEAILIRATQSSDTSGTYISDLTLDTAVVQHTGQGKAVNVESCICPAGYRGTSCEVSVKSDQITRPDFWTSRPIGLDLFLRALIFKISSALCIRPLSRCQ